MSRCLASPENINPHKKLCLSFGTVSWNEVMAASCLKATRLRFLTVLIHTGSSLRPHPFKSPMMVITYLSHIYRTHTGYFLRLLRNILSQALVFPIYTRCQMELNLEVQFSEMKPKV